MRRLGSDVGGKKKESESVDMVNQRIEWQTGSGCVSIGKAVVSDTRGPRFESRHRRSVYWTLLAANCIEKAKIKKNRLETGRLKRKTYLSLTAIERKKERKKEECEWVKTCFETRWHFAPEALFNKTCSIPGNGIGCWSCQYSDAFQDAQERRAAFAFWVRLFVICIQMPLGRADE